MGKKTDGKKKDSTKSGAKSGKVKLPKEIGGVKLPKELRKSGEALIEAARDAAGRELFAAGLTALMTNAARRQTSAPCPPHARHVEAVIVEGDEPRPATKADPLADAIGAVATLALQRLMAAAKKD